MKIRILVTGGTFDKEYDELSGALFFKDTHVQEMLRLGRARLDLAVETVMMIDSLEMDDERRAALLAPCPGPPERRVFGAPGPGTMVGTPRAPAAAGQPRNATAPSGRIAPSPF